MSKTVTIDEKRRASLGPSFSPGDSFVREINGDKVTFTRVEPVRTPAAKVRMARAGGYTVGILDRPIDPRVIAQALEEFP